MNSSKKPFTALHRILHWLVALAMGVLYITGFLRMYWMSKRTVLKAIDQNMPDLNYTKEQALGVAKTILKPMWQWHEFAAYLFFKLIAARILYMLLQGIRFPNPFSTKVSRKERLQGVVYMLFYAFTLISSVTGIYLKWDGYELKEPLEAIHKWAVYWFPAFVIVHFVGIWRAEKADGKGIASKMIGGE